MSALLVLRPWHLGGGLTEKNLRLQHGSECPDYVKTGMQEKEVVWEAELRGMTPEDVAKVVAFLCSSDADYLTSQPINVIGGIVMFLSGAEISHSMESTK